jgi:hypothetical protein
MSPTKSTAVATGTSNGRTLTTVYEMGCETSRGALTRRAAKLGDSPGSLGTYCAPKAAVIPSSKLPTYIRSSSSGMIDSQTSGAYILTNDIAA